MVIIGVLVVGVIIFFATTGSFKFEARYGDDKNKKESTSESGQSTATKDIEWETYKDDQYGYTVKIPRGWTVTNSPSETSREITIMHPGAQAIVLVTSLKDEGLKDITYMKESMKAFKAKLENDPSTVQVAKFEDKVEGNTGGFIAIGEEKRSGVNWYFEQRGLMSTKGRIMLFHGAAQANVYKQYKDIISEIIESFTVVE